MRKISGCIVLVVFCVPISFGSWSLDLETGYVGAGYNDVQIPGDSGSRVSLTNDLKADSRDYYRLRITKSLSSDKYISLLYAPLNLNASGVLASAINYNGDVFTAGASIKGKYRFDSYRATYYKQFNTGKRYNYKLGFTVKVRDAAILLSDGIRDSEKKNTGFVPLFNFGFNYDLTQKLCFVVDGDAVAGGPGRAEDILFSFSYKAGKNHSFRLGYRVVEGGADNKEVYNFALLNYIAAGITMYY